MHGYLWEFTADAWSPNYQQVPVDGSASQPVAATTAVVVRSGSWKDPFPRLTSSARQGLERTQKDDSVGFRCVKSEQLEKIPPKREPDAK
jgi:formylglycine-generating enzyme required for sulfatase activity